MTIKLSGDKNVTGFTVEKIIDKFASYMIDFNLDRGTNQ